MEKKCPSCQQIKKTSDFYKSRSAKDGCSSYCKACCKEKAINNYAKDPERIKAEARRWSYKNPGASMANSYAWKKRNPEKVKEAAKRYYKKKKAERQAEKEALYQHRMRIKEEYLKAKSEKNI